MSLKFEGKTTDLFWKGSPKAIVFNVEGIKEKLGKTNLPCYVIKDYSGRIGISNEGELVSEGRGLQVLATVNALSASHLGDASFKNDYQIKYAYKTGAMANGIASEELVIAIGKANLLASFGAAGLVPQRVKKAIATIQQNLPTQTFAFNLIHSPNEPVLEEESVKLFLQHNINVVEASAFIALTKNIVHYRVAGLSTNADGSINIKNKIIAKVSRKEVAAQFMQTAPQAILNQLLQEGKISQEQAMLSQKVAMADDITVEADSGGHTDNRPLVAILPIIIQLRNEMQAKFQFEKKIRIGAAGGISTPSSALAAFMMGAAYIVTGSVNQACIEAGTSEHVLKLLQNVSSTDIIMAPASDMFEMGVELQVLKRGTMFGTRAKKLYELYKTYNAIEEIPQAEIESIETKIFKKPLEEIWKNCVHFFTERDPSQIERAKSNPKRKMALIFRWYLGLSSNWANAGVEDRKMDYQIWCGPSMGAFNDWVKDTSLEDYKNRNVVTVAEEIMQGASYLYRIESLKMQGVILSEKLQEYKPI